MLFNSWEFFVLTTITFGLYYLPLLRKGQVPILIAASLVFYGWSEPVLVFLLIGSILINAISSYGVVFGAPTSRLRWATLGVGVNLGILIFFKYSGLLFRTFAPGVTASDPVAHFFLTLPLPVGISFFTFQGISLVVDAYRSAKSGTDVIKLDRSFGRHLVTISFFKSFFPQLVAGPIVKAHEFLPQISEKKLSNIDWASAFRFLVSGYFLKMVIADQLKDQTFWLAYPYFQGWSSLTLMTMLFGYSMQIFADFAGYSLIAMGIAALFGYRLPVNFNFPYISRSFSEFWRRWHISLSTWLKQYLYIPLGGNRRGPLRTYLNLFLTMFLGGLWHGAAWSYAVWGTWHGILLAIERRLGWAEADQKTEGPGLAALRMLLVFSFVTFGWLLFKLPDFSHVIAFVRCLGTNTHYPHNRLLIFNVLVYSIPVLAYHAFQLVPKESALKASPRFEALAYGLMLFLVVTNSGDPGAFIYFQF